MSTFGLFKIDMGMGLRISQGEMNASRIHDTL